MLSLSIPFTRLIPMYEPNPKRYQSPHKSWFRRCGNSGLMLPAISLGCWHNFGGAGTDAQNHSDETSLHENCRKMLFTAFDLGITHFDLANNYGPPPGSAESRVGRILREDFASYRDELIISTKAGYEMWPGPYGDFGSRKYLLASLDASLKRLGLDYVDIFYHHRPDPGTPVEESMGALDQAVRSGKAIYAAISNYPGALTADAVAITRREHLTPPILHQPAYHVLHRAIEKDLLGVTQRFGLGVIAFCPLAQGLLTNKYLGGIPKDSRAGTATGFLRPDQITPQRVETIRRLNDIAQSRGQSLAQMALAWTLRSPAVTSALIGASRPEQIKENVASLNRGDFSPEELAKIDSIVAP
jgi:L-glyceraldehyde 3-phosphate reductase